MIIYPYFSRFTATGLVIAAVTTLSVGCSPANEGGAPLEAPEAQVGEASTAEDAPIEVGPLLEDVSGTEQPTEAEEASTEKLPEVVSINTRQLGGLLDKTLGKVTVLNIWATWCGPCVHEMPDLVAFYNETDRSEIAFVSLSIDTTEEITGEIPKFQKAHNIPFPIYVLNERDDEALLTSLRAQFRGGIPVTFIYDVSGKMVTMIEGAVTQSGLNEALDPLLKTGS